MDNGGTQLPGADGPDSLEIISEMISLICMSIMASLLGAKSKGERLANLTYGRILVFAVYILSWAFAVTSMLTVSTNNFNITSCTLAMMSCDVFYAGSKIVIYMWLIERVHLVTAIRTTRFKSWQYRFHIILLIPYVGIFVLMLTFRNIYLLDSGECIIGLRWIASMPLMFYDFFLNLYLTYLFIKPLTNVKCTAVRTNWKATRLYKLTKRTLIASLVCLLVSLANVLSVVITRGHLRGLICMTCCTLDVTINVATIHWVTTSTTRMSARHTGTVDSEDFNQNTGYGTPAHQTHERPNDFTTDYFSYEKYNYENSQTSIHEQSMHHQHRQRHQQQQQQRHNHQHQQHFNEHHHNKEQRHHRHQRQESDDSVRSIQVSQSSLKPLHEPSL